MNAITVTAARRWPVALVGLAATVLAATVLYGYGAVARAIEGPMRAGDVGASRSYPVTPESFAFGVVFCTTIGTVLAMGLARWAKQPARTFVRVTLALVVVSLASPLAASHTVESTRITLACGHLLAASIVIPIIARRLSDARS